MIMLTGLDCTLAPTRMGFGSFTVTLSSKGSNPREVQYRKNPKILDTWKFAVITLKVEQRWLFLRVMHPKDAEGIANRVDPDQTAPLIWVYTVCLNLPVRKLRNITVIF